MQPLLFYITLLGRGGVADGIYGIFIGNGIDNHLSFNIALWFLPMLFLCNVIFCCCVRFSQYIQKVRMQYVVLATICTILTIIGYAMIVRQRRLFWGIETALFSQFFMLLGYNFKMLNVKLGLDIKHKKWLICLCPIIMIIWWFGACYNGRVDMNAGKYGNIFLFFVIAIFGFYVVWQISFLVGKVYPLRAIFSTLGRNSLYIMGYHIPATYIVYDVILPYMPTVIKTNAYQPNVIGVLYLCVGDIIMALLMKILHTSKWQNQE